MSTAVFHEDPAAEMLRTERLKQLIASEDSIAENKVNAEPLAEARVSPLLPPTTEDVEEPVREEPHISTWTRVTSIVTLLLFYVMAYIRESYRKVFPHPNKFYRKGYAPIVKDFDDYWNRRFYRRIRECFTRPIDSRPSRVIGIMERTVKDMNSEFEYTGKITPAINLGSYNYLGFAEDTPSITYDVLDTIDDLGLASCSGPQELGQSAAVARLEKEFAAFLGKEDALVCGMGFGTNFRGLPSLFGKDTLAVSDTLNHSSLVNGVRSSGAKVKVFKHDAFDQLETILREAVILGQTPAGEYKPWRRIVVIIEGIYSMEGEIINLKKVVELKKKYKALLFIDEAHSIGAIGRTGRGVCEHCGVDPKDVDVLMGTFTKSFGSIGGYIASSKPLVDYLRQHSSIALHCDTLAPPCAQQVVSVLNVILGKDGTDLGRKRIQQLKENSRFFRRGLMDLGFIVLGDDASPVIPVMCYNLGKLAPLSELLLSRGVAIVVVGYPATPLLESRVRFCVSATHTREDLQYVLDVMRDVSKDVYMDYRTHSSIFQYHQ
ncbi:serine palmitoyltransferase [Strigomonas culicis]|uniref:serine C-palmitoyltransferase n=1 Tax=Strigomonas culicis TaxID=28005 RepID=S9U7S8_9TRYP|nr:serine palmitoyltransferase [Strigomonas culicis]EPY24948.1 serine palmitoyltransferase [Strigomonas culicis]EPY35655.1 serine palmitoyltransferase [Strigomonas culicis]|eukprot:EPY23036.1 serine palmitoyltransferase [Strigomonas culicis]